MSEDMTLLFFTQLFGHKDRQYLLKTNEKDKKIAILIKKLFNLDGYS